ncbi:uncharacterized protein LOC126606006 [Malus sylvestris]|uniref:uncharacterized protein LOC126606006 n=1 Tax=Malus sylvestris TaxID=3752 RepID=UPI0021AC789B|nr:uncharacterized protein LOC126606006 [Malus sylvestris]
MTDSQTEGSEEGDKGEEDEETWQTDTDSDSNYSPIMASPPSDIPLPPCIASPHRDLPVPRIAGRSDKRPLADRPKKPRRGSPTIFGTTLRPMQWQSVPPTFGSASGDGSNNSSQAWRLEFTKRDGSFVTLGDDLLGNANATTAVARGLLILMMPVALRWLYFKGKN